jgi:hypothetical protein
MKSARITRASLGVVMLASLVGCAVPQRFWPQKDIAASEAVGTNRTVAVLVASRSSDYKKLLVAELQKQLSAAGIQHKAVGVEDLKKVDADDYAVVVVINTCLAWGLDHDVESFLDRQKATDNVILLTTSGDGSWLPNKRGRDFDAISGASVTTNVNTVAANLMGRIQKQLGKKPKTDAQ